MVITNAMIEEQKGKTVFDLQLLGDSNENESKTMTHGDLSDLFVRVAELEEEIRSRLARVELGVPKFRVVIGSGDEPFHPPNSFNLVQAFQEQLGDFNDSIEKVRQEIKGLKYKLGEDGELKYLVDKYEAVINSFKDCYENWGEPEIVIDTLNKVNEIDTRLGPQGDIEMKFVELHNYISSIEIKILKWESSNHQQNYAPKEINFESESNESSTDSRKGLPSNNQIVGTNNDNQTEDCIIVQNQEGSNLDGDDLVEVFEIGKNLSLQPFNGEGDISFTEWLIRFQDLADAQSTPWAGALKLNKLKFMLEGLAREKFEQLSVAEKADYELAVVKLTSLFENSMSRNIARQSLRNCKHIKGEAVRAFMTRLKKVVTAATVGQGDQMFQQVLLDEFMDRLEPTLGFHVKISQPATVEEALNRALHMEHLIEAEKVAKQEEIEKIAGIVRATMQNNK